MLARHGGVRAREALRGACVDDILRRREPAADPACRKAIADALAAVSSKDADSVDVEAIAKQEANASIADALSAVARITPPKAALEPVPTPPPLAPALSPKDRTSSTKLFGRLSHGDDIDEEAEEEDDEFEFDDDK